jgi:uncharacterized protein DUF4236
MGLRWRKGVRLAPGLKLNLGLKGGSLSLGGRGLTLNLGRKGARTTVGLPGSGLSYSWYSRFGVGNGGFGPVLVLAALVILAYWLG